MNISLDELYAAMYSTACENQCSLGACCADFVFDVFLTDSDTTEIRKMVKDDFRTGRKTGMYPCHLKWNRELGKFYEEAANIKNVLELIPEDAQVLQCYRSCSDSDTLCTDRSGWLSELISGLYNMFYIHIYSGEEELETHLIRGKSGWRVVELDTELTRLGMTEKCLSLPWVPEIYKQQLRKAEADLSDNPLVSLVYHLFESASPLTNIWAPVLDDELTDDECLELTAAYINICC
jgi:hypothetical protein